MCKSSKMFKVLDLGFSALADNFLTKEQLGEPETVYPLDVYMCENCGLFQLGYVVPPEIMYNESYPYESSTTQRGCSHFTAMAHSICDKFGLKGEDMAIDVGSNVGVLLSGFKSRGLKVLGVEPSSNIAQIAINNGIDTVPKFFNSKLASELGAVGRVSVITGTNVFAHIHDVEDFVRAADVLLSEKGVIVIEAPYLVKLLNHLEYDTIYHEHLSYLSLRPMAQFFSRLGFEVFDVEMQDIHGGSFRCFVGRKGKRGVSERIRDLTLLEEKEGVYSRERLGRFAQDVFNHRKELSYLLADLKKQGKRIAGISAPAKGNTLLNYCRIGPETLDYVTEKSKLKIGKFTPGMHIPVYSDDALLADRPDYALILAWNFAEEIIENNKKYREMGGKFIVPIPRPHVI